MNTEVSGRQAGGSFTIREWCTYRRVSVSFFYKMRAEGWGPDTMAAGARETISSEADAKWVREREAAAAAGIRRKLPNNSAESAKTNPVPRAVENAGVPRRLARGPNGWRRA